MTRVTNLVKRKRTYISDPDPSASRDRDETNPAPKRAKHGHASSSGTGQGRGGFRGEWSRNNERGPKDRAAASEQRRQKRADDRVADKTCFACRETGHTARDCPNAVSVGEGKSSVGLCYRCGSNKHTLSRCRKPENKANSLPFAQCFVCSQSGHLAGSCPSNMNGLYPNGGGCKLCDQNDHLAKDCPTRLAESSKAPIVGLLTTDSASYAHEAGADEDDFHVLKRRTNVVNKEEAALSRLQKISKKSPPSSDPYHIPPPLTEAPPSYDIDPLADSTPLPPAPTTHPSRQALLDGAEHPEPPRLKKSKLKKHAQQPATPIPTPKGPEPLSLPFGSSAPAFIPRGSAALPMRKTKVVSF